jgi:hypothetical protein
MRESPSKPLGKVDMGLGFTNPVPLTQPLRTVAAMNSTEDQEYKAIADAHASVGAVFNGRYGDLVSLWRDIESILPPGVRVVYKRFSGIPLYIRAEGETP